MRKAPATAAIVAMVVFAGCGEEDSGSTSGDGGNGGSGGGTGCLTPREVEQQVNRIASGVEASPEEAAAKQRAIRELRRREC